MPTTWDISFSHKVSGVPTDVTSAKLNDAASAYGVRRVSNGAVIVAAGTALAHDGTGLYSYSVPSLTPGVAYEAWIEWVYAGETKRVRQLFTASSAGIGVHFTTKDGTRDTAGHVNADTYADKDGDADPDKIAAAWEDALARTDAEIIQAFRVRLFEAGKGTAANFATYDLVPGAVADASDSAWLDETARWGTIVKLYEGRGQADDGTSAGPSPDGKMEVLRKRYEERLEAIRTGTALLATAAAAGITIAEEWGSVPVADPVYPTVDADGLPATASNVPSWYRGPRWDRAYGYRY